MRCQAMTQCGTVTTGGTVGGVGLLLFVCGVGIVFVGACLLGRWVCHGGGGGGRRGWRGWKGGKVWSWCCWCLCLWVMEEVMDGSGEERGGGGLGMALIALRGDGPIHGMVVWAARMPLELPEVGIPTREGPTPPFPQTPETRDAEKLSHQIFLLPGHFLLLSFIFFHIFFPLPYL